MILVDDYHVRHQRCSTTKDKFLTFSCLAYFYIVLPIVCPASPNALRPLGDAPRSGTAQDRDTQCKCHIRGPTWDYWLTDNCMDRLPSPPNRFRPRWWQSFCLARQMDVHSPELQGPTESAAQQYAACRSRS